MLLGREKKRRKSGKKGDEQSDGLSWRTASLWSHRELGRQTAVLCQPFLGARKPSFLLPCQSASSGERGTIC